MKLRMERKNVIEFVDEKIVRKIGKVQEKTRPYRLKVEAWALSQARSQGVNVPKVIDYFQDSEGKEILVLERIHGRSLSLKISQENLKCVFDVGRQMTLLCNTSVNYGWIDPVHMNGSSKSWQTFLLTFTQTYGERLVKERIIEESYLQKIYWTIQFTKLNIPVPFLVNGDIRPSHLIKDDAGKVWIIDWENVRLGDPLYDLALFGVRYGHGMLWQNLRLGCEFNFLPQKYVLYEILALVGIVDFYRKNRISYDGKLKKLIQLINSI